MFKLKLLGWLFFVKLHIFPCLNFFSEVFLIQFLLVYVLYNIYYSSNIFYVVFYTLFEIILFGIFLCFYQMDLFAAFLWLSESVVVFVSILLCFYLNVYGSSNKINLKFYSFKFLGSLLLLFVVTYSIVFPSLFETFFFFENIFKFDNWYGASGDFLINDLFGLFTSYYFINSFEFICIFILLLVGSVVCVNLNRIGRLNKIVSYDNFFLIFDFFKDFSKFIFMRKQNLVDQENHLASTRIFKKKIINNY